MKRSVPALVAFRVPGVYTCSWCGEISVGGSCGGGGSLFTFWFWDWGCGVQYGVAGGLVLYCDQRIVFDVRR